MMLQELRTVFHLQAQSSGWKEQTVTHYIKSFQISPSPNLLHIPSLTESGTLDSLPKLQS